jgi:putative membrane protein
MPKLSPKEEEAIREAVRRAEEKTSGEIVPMVVPTSSTYAEVDLIAGLIGLAGASLAAVWLLPDPQYLILFALQLAGWIVGVLACRLFPAVKRTLLSQRVAQEEVLERALRAFQDLGLHRTRDRTGVLILVSFLERRVQVLADTGINARVKPGAWDRVVQTVLDGVRKGDLCAGLCEGIAVCGEILAAEFPIQPGDRNELADDLRRA